MYANADDENLTVDGVPILEEKNFSWDSRLIHSQNSSNIQKKKQIVISYPPARNEPLCFKPGCNNISTGKC